MDKHPKTEHYMTKKIALIAGSALFVLPNLFYIYLGWFVRLRADDFCFTGTLREYGFMKGLSVFYNTLSNRFSAFLVWSFSEMFGDYAIRFFSMTAIALFSFAAFWAGRKLLRSSNIAMADGVAFFISQAFTFFTLYLAPNIHQAVYWRAAMVHYFLPIPLLVFILMYVFTHPNTTRHIYRKAFLLFLVSIFLAGLSESYAGLHGGAFALIFLFWIVQRDKKKKRVLAAYSLAGILGVLVTLLIMIVSPGNALKFMLEDQANDLFSISTIAMDSAYSFIYYSLRGLWLPVGILLMLGILVGSLFISEIGILLPRHKILHTMLLIPLVVFFLIFCISAPTAYGMMAYPEKRVLMLAMPILLAGIFALGVLASLAIQPKLKSTPAVIPILSTIFLILSLYPLSTYQTLNHIAGLYRVRAQLWDQQQGEILQQIDQGKRDLTVIALDSHAEIAEMRDDDTFWVNLCVAQYYNVDTISAVEK